MAFWQRVIATTALGCVLDALLLAAFAAGGTVPMNVPILYAAVGLAWCAIFYVLAARAARSQLGDVYLSLPLLIVSSSIQLLFIWAAIASVDGLSISRTTTGPFMGAPR